MSNLTAAVQALLDNTLQEWAKERGFYAFVTHSSGKMGQRIGLEPIKAAAHHEPGTLMRRYYAALELEISPDKLSLNGELMRLKRNIAHARVWRPAIYWRGTGRVDLLGTASNWERAALTAFDAVKARYAAEALGATKL